MREEIEIEIVGRRRDIMREEIEREIVGRRRDIMREERDCQGPVTIFINGGHYYN